MTNNSENYVNFASQNDYYETIWKRQNIIETSKILYNNLNTCLFYEQFHF